MFKGSTPLKTPDPSHANSHISPERVCLPRPNFTNRCLLTLPSLALGPASYSAIGNLKPQNSPNLEQILTRYVTRHSWLIWMSSMLSSSTFICIKKTSACIANCVAGLNHKFTKQTILLCQSSSVRLRLDICH